MTGVTPTEEIINNIKEMGYITVRAKTINPSFYKLKDRTIIKIQININHLVEDSKSPQGFTINSTNTAASYVPKENRRPELYSPFDISDMQSSIIDEDMKPEVLQEDFSVYDLSNGMELSIKAVVAQISKSKLYTTDGEPLYAINSSPIFKVTKNAGSV